jgi:hypothetical protein
MVKRSESPKTLASVSADLFGLVEQFKDPPDITGMHSYKLWEQVLKEQCTVKAEGTRVAVKRPKENPF